MYRNITQVMACLNTMGIDINYERSLLNNLLVQTETETILVIGDQQSNLFSLLPLAETILSQDDMPDFPLEVEYGQKFSIRVTNIRGEKESYKSAEDFRHFCGNRLGEISGCSLRVPDEGLRQLRLVYFMLNGNVARLNSVAQGSSSCILVAAADAGGLSEDYLELCRWLTEVWNISPRTCLVLTHRGSFANRMLGFMAQSSLNRKKLGVVKCGTGRPGLLSPRNALESAVADIQERQNTDMEAGVVRACADSLTRKLTVEFETAKADADRFRFLGEDYLSARRTFQAMCVTEKYAFTQILTGEELEDLQREIRAMFAQLNRQYPRMVDEVLEKSRDPKEDLKNLSGDHLSALVESFVTELLHEVMDRLLIPRANQRFEDLCERFRRMMQDEKLEYTDIEENAQTAFLRMSDVNIGDFHTMLARITGALLSAAVKMVLNCVFQDAGYYIGIFLENHVRDAVIRVTDGLMPVKMFAQSLCKALLVRLEEMEKEVLKQIELTILPRLSGELLAEFERLVAVYDEQLQTKADAYMEQSRQAEQRTRQLQSQLDLLKT